MEARNRKGEKEMTTATVKRKPGTSTKPTGGVTTIKCAFCDGTGRDPYEILSKISDCPVCKGHKTVEAQTPFVACLYCKGTGRQRHTRLTCSACRGKGVIPMAGPTTKCAQCGGAGREPEADLPCSLCKGTGLVPSKKLTAPKQEHRTASKGRVGSKSQ